MEGQQNGELDLGLVLRRMTRRWPLVLGLAFGGALLGGGITAFLPPVYEAKSTLIFPAGNTGGGLPGLGLQGTIGSENMELVEGIVTSRDVEDQIVNATGLDREIIRDNLKVNQIPGRRQVVLSYDSADKAVGLKVIEGVLQHLTKVEEAIGVNASDKRLTGYRAAYDAKVDVVHSIENEILNFQKSAKTVPTAEDGFTGMAYLKERSDLKGALEKVNRQITAKKSAATAVGSAAGSGLPTGLLSEAKWRDALLEASIELDQARAKYQPGTPQVKAAEEKLETTKTNLAAEIGKYVQSVQQGADAEMAGFLAEKVIAQWQLTRAEELASVAPQEAATYRRLLDKLKIESQARDELKIQADAEEVRGKVEAKIWEILDKPYVDEEPVNKKFAMNIGLGLIVGGLFGAILSNGSKKQ